MSKDREENAETIREAITRSRAIVPTVDPVIAEMNGSNPEMNITSTIANEPAIRFSGWNGRSMAEAVLTLLDLPAKERQAMGRSAASRVAAQLDWGVIAANAADFIETTTSHSKSGLSKTCCQSSAPV